MAKGRTSFWENRRDTCFRTDLDTREPNSYLGTVTYCFLRHLSIALAVMVSSVGHQANIHLENVFTSADCDLSRTSDDSRHPSNILTNIHLRPLILSFSMGSTKHVPSTTSLAASAICGNILERCKTTITWWSHHHGKFSQSHGSDTLSP